MNKKERLAYILRRSRDLADTGDFAGWLQIEWRIVHQERLHEARHVLDNSFIRSQLDEACKRARAKELVDADRL
ncbi:hypothetical protein [Mesorhizobium sp. B261B1A]|uniref:hypothetical protein n=1 Tax=Mesorhizobium sp. B261B1A TaxID=2876671 RepID=UPI001CD140EE|nr:hypothetical protein [Mesorhizobium sp. B261B1A]MCA0058034.1 hypothetical protein [Mesorhizobium sp. B261B1A]